MFDLSPTYAPTKTTYAAPANEYELKRDREKHGRCANCGLQTHNLKRSLILGTLLVPITNETVLSGRCLACNPLTGISNAQASNISALDNDDSITISNPTGISNAQASNISASDNDVSITISNPAGISNAQASNISASDNDVSITISNPALVNSTSSEVAQPKNKRRCLVIIFLVVLVLGLVVGFLSPQSYPQDQTSTEQPETFASTTSTEQPETFALTSSTIQVDVPDCRRQLQLSSCNPDPNCNRRLQTTTPAEENVTGDTYSWLCCCNPDPNCNRKLQMITTPSAEENVYPDGNDEDFGCLDVYSADTTNGNIVWLYPCNDTPAQYWCWDPYNGDHYIRSSVDTGKCLVTSGGNTELGTGLVITDCIENDQSFVWDRYVDKSIRPRNNGSVCIEMSKEDTGTVGSYLILDACNEQYEWIFM